MSQTATLSELAAKISVAASTIDNYLKANNVPSTSLKADSPMELPSAPEVAMARMELLDLLNDMKILAQGPAETITFGCLQTIHDQSVLNILNEFNFWDAVPLTGSASYASIAAKVGLQEAIVYRILRHAITRRLFAEAANGDGVQHTSVSAAPARSPLMRAWVGHCLDEVARGAVEMPTALHRWARNGAAAEDGEPDHCGCGIALLKHGEQSLFDFFAVDADEERGLPAGWRMKRFGDAMTCATSDDSFSLSAVHNMYGWDELPQGSTLVDIGGSAGHVSVEIAKRHPNMSFVVQDRPELAPSFAKVVPETMKSRITFQGHDFFTPQPVKGAAVYFLKHILHDWSDEWSVRILKQIIPVMGPDSKIILMEGLFPDPGKAPNYVTRMMSSLDLHMMTACNSKERTVGEWAALCKMADERLVVKNITAQPGIAFAIIEIVLQH